MKYKNILLIFLSAIFSGIAHQPFQLGFLIWFSIIPLIYIINEVKNYKDLFKYSFLWGFLYHLTIVFWLSQNIGTIPIIAFISMILTVLYLSFNTIIFTSIWFYLKKNNLNYNLILIPIVWTLVEYIKSYGLLAFPWISVANSQANYLYLIQISEFTGIYGITFWIISINVILFSLWKKISTNKIYIFTLVFIFPWIMGFIIYKNVESYFLNDFKIALIQPNINLSDSRNFSKGQQLLDSLIVQTSLSLNKDIDLVLWPEAALPFHNVNNGKTFDYIKKRLLNNNQISILSGDITNDHNKIYNSVVLFDKYGVKSIYNKQRPVPLAEQVPMSETFPFLQSINLGVANYSSGKKDVLFEIDNFKFSSLICYESVFPEINRRHVNKGADFITFLVNDAWYPRGPEPEQHARQSIFRAIENRKSVIRCANTGISMIINPNGDIVKKTQLNTKAILIENIKGTDYKTFYTKFGNVFAQILFLIVIILIIKKFFGYDEII